MNIDMPTAPQHAPRILLTEAQHEHYVALLQEAAELRTAGNHEQARRVTRLATDIARTGPPACE